MKHKKTPDHFFSSTPVVEDLIWAFRLLAMMDMDDLTYTHASARAAEKDTFYINKLGPLFDEVCEDLLVKVSSNPQEDQREEANLTGQMIHQAIYKARPDVGAIIHLHTPEGVAVSALEEGLCFLSQFSFHFINNLAYHTYGGLVLAGEEGKRLVENLGNVNAMILRNHGLLTVGRTVHEAFFYMYYLHIACKVQLMAQATGKKLLLPDKEMKEQAHEQMRNFEANLGLRDWLALKRRYLRRTPLPPLESGSSTQATLKL